RSWADEREPYKSGSPLKSRTLSRLAVRGRQILLLHGPHAVLIGRIGLLVASLLDLCGVLMAHVGRGVDRRCTQSERAGADGNKEEQGHVTSPFGRAGNQRRCLLRVAVG